MTSTASESAVPPRAYEVVLKSVEADLRAGRLKIGEQLPGERSLAEMHGISRASVRDAIRILDAMGMVRTSSGSGPNSGAVVISDPAVGLSATLRLHVASRQLPVADIVESRVLLETWAAQSADLAANPERSAMVLERTAELLEAMDVPGLDREAFHVLDAQFHVLLSSLAGNVVIESMMESLRLSISDYVSESIEGEESWQEISSVLRTQHHGIHDAVAAGDGTEAARLLREHIEWFYAETQAK